MVRIANIPGQCLTALAIYLICVQGLAAMPASEKPTRLHPPAELHGWKVTSPEGMSVTPKTIFKYMDGAGEIYLAYDFRELKVWTYGGNGATSITVEAYEMGSPEDAFGVLMQDFLGKDAKIGGRSAYGMGFLQFWKGRWYFRILADDETTASRKAVLDLGRAFAAQVPGESREPKILGRLPRTGKVADSEHYFHTQICLNALYFFAVDNILQLSKNTDAVMAGYRFGKESAKLLIIEYPNAAAATHARAAFLKGYLPELTVAAEPVLLTQIEKDEWIGLRLEGRYLALAFKSHSRDVCERLLKGANLERGGKKQ